MSEFRRVGPVPAWLLHQYPYRESSLIVEVFTLEYGRLGLVARGARTRHRGGNRLALFMPLMLSFHQRGELGTLIDAEATARPGQYAGHDFFAACYLNELILKLLPRADPAPEAYQLYGEALEGIASSSKVAVRRFEGRLLRTLGLVPSLRVDGSGLALSPRKRYHYVAGQGLVESDQGYSERTLAAIEAEYYDNAVVYHAAGQLFHAIIGAHLGRRRLKTVAVAREVAQMSWGNKT